MSRERTTAKQPSRRRGYQRVTRLLDAAARVFEDKGYDGATMTGIAAEAETSIGSLYQFFPSKETLADALLARYAEHADRELATVVEQAPGLSSDALADALVEFIVGLKFDKVAAIALGEARGAPDKRTDIRRMMHERLAMILATTRPTLTADQRHTAATMLLHLLQTVDRIVREQTLGSVLRSIDESRRLLRIYLAHGVASGTA